MNADPSRPATTRRGRLLTLGWLATAGLMVATVTPARWGWTGWPVVLNLVAFPLVLGLALGVIALALGVGTLSRRSQDRRTRVGIALVLAAVALFQVSTVVRRGGWWAPAVASQPGDIVVMSFNSAGQEPLPAEVLDILRDRRPQIVALPETRPQVAAALVAQAADVGLDYQLFSQRVQTGVSVTSLLVSDDLGTYELDRDGSDRAGAVRAVPADGDGPLVVAVHPESPTLLGTNAGSWQAAGRRAVAQCTGTPGAIVVGDFNATIDHPQLGELGFCRDAATQIGRAAQGTWPAALPATAAGAIDHVLTDGRRWRAVDLDTARVGRSDHRMIIATLRAR